MLAEAEAAIVERMVRDIGFVDCVLDLQQRFMAANISAMQVRRRRTILATTK